MSSTIWRPWEDNRTKREVRAENQDKGYNKLAVSGLLQQLLLNCYGYFLNRKYDFITDFWEICRLESATLLKMNTFCW